MIDIREEYDGEKVIIKLTQKQLSQLLNGKILEGFRTRVGMDNNLNN